MIYNKIVTNDNQTITSENLMNLTVTWETNSETNIKPGSCVSTMVSGEVVGDYTDWEDVTDFTLYSTHDSDLTNATWTKVGVFYVQNTKPNGKNRFSIEAYDAISKLEVNVANYVYNNWVNSWASSTKTVFQLLSAICTQCGITAQAMTSEYRFPAVAGTYTDSLIISLEGLANYSDWTTNTITGRQIISWLAELCGCYVVINPENNQLQFSWYDTDNLSWQKTKYSNVYAADTSLLFEHICDVITPSSSDVYTFDSTRKNGKSYKQGTLTFDRYTVDNEDFYAVVEKDDGTSGYYYPRTAAPGDSTPKYMISDNRFICSLAVNNNSTESSKITNLALLVQRVRTAVAYANYKPFSATIFPVSVDAGDVLRGFCGFPVGVIDYSGNRFKTIITKCVRSVNGLTISSTGEEEGGVYQTSSSSTQGNVSGKVVTVIYPNEDITPAVGTDPQTAFLTVESAIKANGDVLLKIVDSYEEESGLWFAYRYASLLYAEINRDEDGILADSYVWFVEQDEYSNSYLYTLNYEESSSPQFSWGELQDYSIPHFYKGTTAPSSSQSSFYPSVVTGSFYINKTNGDIYHCTGYTLSTVTWEQIGSGSGGTTNFNELTNRPSYNSTTMTGSTNIPRVPIVSVQTSEPSSPQDGDIWIDTDESFDITLKTVNGQSILGSGNVSAIPTGGTAGQILSKVDGTDYNTEWIDPSSASGAELTANKVTAWSETPTDTHYPSEKLVYDTIGDVSDLLDALLNGVS